MWVMHVERVQGDYLKPEIIDLEDGTGCLFRLHHSDVTEDGADYLTDLLTRQAQSWAPRPPGAPLGPVIPVRWERVPVPDPRLAVGVDDLPHAVTYLVDPPLLTQRAADHLGWLGTNLSPYWQRVPDGYHGDNAVDS